MFAIVQLSPHHGVELAGESRGKVTRLELVGALTSQRRLKTCTTNKLDGIRTYGSSEPVTDAFRGAVMLPRKQGVEASSRATLQIKSI